MPSCARLLATARPMPLVPPVTSAVNKSVELVTILFSPLLQESFSSCCRPKRLSFRLLLVRLLLEALRQGRRFSRSTEVWQEAHRPFLAMLPRRDPTDALGVPRHRGKRQRCQM